MLKKHHKKVAPIVTIMIIYMVFIIFQRRKGKVIYDEK